MTTTEPEPVDGGATEAQRSRAPAGRTRMIAAAILGGIVAVFALLNFNDVKVHWLVASGQTPLIVVIVLAFAFGMIADRLVVIRGRKRRAPQ